jgi:hypothetical protein
MIRRETRNHQPRAAAKAEAEAEAPAMSDLEVARQIAFVLSMGAREKGEPRSTSWRSTVPHDPNRVPCPPQTTPEPRHSTGRKLVFRHKHVNPKSLRV